MCSQLKNYLIIPAIILSLALPVEAKVPQHRVTVSGAIEITDDEVFRDERGTVPVGGTIVIDADTGAANLVQLERCVGDEVRVTLDLNARATNANIETFPSSLT